MSTRASGMARNGTTGEAGVAVGGVGVDEVFVSPRVVDRRAYAELAGELREMVEVAGRERAALTAALDQAGKAAQDFARREQAQQGNIELAARALKALDERSGRVEQLLARAADQTKLFEGVETQINTMVQAKVAAMEARLEAVSGGAMSKTDALEERIRRASRELEQRIEAIRRDAQTIAGPAQEGLARLCERAQTLAGGLPGSLPAPGSLGDLVGRAQEAVGEAEALVKRFEEMRGKMREDRESLEQIAQRREEITGGLHRLREDAERALREATERMQSRRDEAAGVVARLGEEIDRNLEEVRTRLTEQQKQAVSGAESAIQETQKIIGELQEQSGKARTESAGAINELRTVVQQSIEAHNTTALALKLLATSIEQAKGITAQLEPWRGLLDGQGKGSTPEPIRKMVEMVRTELRGELSGIAGALRSAAERAERVHRELDQVPAGAAGPAAPAAAPKPAVNTTPAAGATPAGHPLVGARVAPAPLGGAGKQVRPPHAAG